MHRNPNQRVRRTAQEAFSRLAAELEAGQGEALARYLTALSRFRQYSWQNVLLIAAQRPGATHVAGVHTWNDFGRLIKRGEPGILILAPEDAKKSVVRIPPQTDPLRLAGFRAAAVFDVSQTEGRPFPPAARAAFDPQNDREQMSALIAQRTVELKLDPWLTEAVAYVVSRGLGLKPEALQADWAALDHGDREALACSLATIRRVSAEVLDKLLAKELDSGRVLTGSTPERWPMDAEGFGLFHRQYRDRVVQSIVGFVRDHDTAQDIAARAFQIGWEKRDRFRGEASPHTWIQAIARNAARDSENGARKVQFEPIDRFSARELPAPELVTDELEKRDDQVRLQRALTQLPAKHRRALVAHFVNGLSVREVARREGVPFGTVLSRIHKGKQLLREAWQSTVSLAHPSERASEPAPAKPREGQPPAARPTSAQPDPMAESRDLATWDR